MYCCVSTLYRLSIEMSCVLDDHSRVVLHNSDKPDSDYINANYIDVSNNIHYGGKLHLSPAVSRYLLEGPYT